MKKLALALLSLLLASVAQAQVSSWPPAAGSVAILCVYNSSPPTLATTNPGFIQCDSVGNVRVTGTLATTQSGTWTVQPGNTANTTPWLTTNIPSTASGAGIAPVASSALAANQVVKASAGNLYSFQVSADSTLSGAAWWIMLYDATSAPVDGAITPLKCYAQASGVTSYSAAFMVPISFATGITIGVSTTGCFTKTASTHAFISGDAK